MLDEQDKQRKELFQEFFWNEGPSDGMGGLLMCSVTNRGGNIYH